MYQEYIDFIVPLAKQVAKLQLSYFRTDRLGIETKSNISDVVTRADKESEELIAKAIFEKYPDHKILGEEGGFRGNEDSQYLWVVDPLDGTTNFSQGISIFSISIALQYNGETIAGVVYAPYLDELFVATKGGGAYMAYHGGELKKIHVAGKKYLDSSVIATGFPYDKVTNPDNNTKEASRIVPLVRDLRRLGSAAHDLCCVASGILDGYWEMSLKIWDVCAGILIVEEAGGKVLHYRDDRSLSVIAGNETIARQIREIISQDRDLGKK
ncbi:MAG: inositol monophosphatase/fructose-1,6-bisphosphatase family protein [Bacteroidetes bacterium]|nr:inositol monophosphatase/fructose-1,6-bisphosphatase family protein [Bacteroidota bacterium]